MITFRLEKYELSDDTDDIANFLIFSLQTDQIIPSPIKNESEMAILEKRIQSSMTKFEMSRIELLRNISVDCREFLVFMRIKSFGENIATWPELCGDIFYDIPIFTPFGTCFTTKMELR